MRLIKKVVLGFIGGLAAASAGASTATLTFEGLLDDGVCVQEDVGGFYGGTGGGCGSLAANYGITFEGAAGAVDTDFDPNGTGSFANEPSGETAMFFYALAARMVVSAGFTQLSFYYSSVTGGTVNFYDSLDSSGTLVGSLTLPANVGVPSSCAGDPTGDIYCEWTLATITLAGTALSADFGTFMTTAAFDDMTVTFANNNAVPEPGSLALLAIGAAALVGAQRRKGAASRSV